MTPNMDLPVSQLSGPSDAFSELNSKEEMYNSLKLTRPCVFCPQSENKVEMEEFQDQRVPHFDVSTVSDY